MTTVRIFNQSAIMNKSLFTLLVICAFTLLYTSCKQDAPVEDLAFIEVDFLMNEQDHEKFGVQYTPSELERNSNDPNRVLTVNVGEPVTFKDSSKGSSSQVSRKWLINDNEWKEVKKDKKTHVPEFTHVFKEPGYHRITLSMGDNYLATKIINVVSGEYIPSEPVLADNMPEEETNEVTEIDTPEPVKKDLLTGEELKTNASSSQNTSSSSSSSSSSSNVASTETPRRKEPVRPPARKDPKPAPVAKVSSVSFSAPSEVIVGASFELKDNSSPASAVRVRQWDLGDGSTQKVTSNSYRHMYFAAGEKTITLCVNNTDQCTTKRIMVKPRPEPKKEVAKNTPKPEPKPTPPAPPKKPEISKVEFNMPATAEVGATVNVLDRSQPASAVMKRSWKWGDATPDLSTGRGSVSHVFNKAGTYTVELCVNDNSSKCTKKTITITEKPKEVVKVEPKPEPKPENTSTTTGSSATVGKYDLSNYSGSNPGNVGLLSSMKCDETEFSWHTGAAFINLEPKKPFELEEAKVYADGNGTIDVILTSADKKESAVIKNIQVNPGASVIYLTDLAMILTPDQKYTLMIKPSDANPDLKLENSIKCSPNTKKSDVVNLNYNKKFVIYDLKYYY